MRCHISWALLCAVATVAACGDSAPAANTLDVAVTPDITTDAGSNDIVVADVQSPPDVPAPIDASDVASEPADDRPLECAVGRTVCDGRCVDTATDTAHCGTCGTVCPVGNACREGRCVVVCPGAQLVCGGACVSTTTDPAHCGACDMACAAGQVCTMGSCACPTDAARCGDRCVDTRSDASNCGTCGTACQRGEVCAAGRCQLTCPTGQTACGAACVTVATDALHCGACDARCSIGARCEAGMCRCPEGQTDCDGRCVDTASSTAHCGACGRACSLASATAACVAGACRVVGCEAGRGDCDGMATNGCEATVTSDVAHCGACGRACALAHATPTCTMGACAVGTCDAGFANCDAMAANGCEVDTSADARNCGACGAVCSTGRCSAGRCNAPRSCLELKMLTPTTPDGSYTIDPDGAGPIAPFTVWCDMTTSGGGWTHLATITNNGDAPNTGRWLLTSPAPNAWESTSLTFGTLDPAVNADYRSAAFHSVEGRALMITHRGLFLLATDDACLAGRTLQASMTRLGWTCGGSENFASHPACTNPCVIASSTPRTGDTALLAGVARARLYLKAGEADGAQDSNRDRAYLSTSYRDNVDYPTGLGAFCSGSSCSPRTGEADVNDRSDAITPTAGTEFYGVWIR